MITFKSIFYKNFLSTGNQGTKILLNRSPSTLITGTNGAGKSTILDAIVFGLFNKPFRNINKPALVNSITAGDCVVEIEFSIGKKDYKIVRGIKPTIFDIFENGKLIPQDAANRDYQKHLEDSILGGLNETIFKQIVILGSADYQPFMQLAAAKRREVVEELLDIRIFSHMLELAKQRLLTYKDTLKTMDYDISLQEEKINLHKQNQKNLKEQVKEKKSLLNEKIQAEHALINEINIAIVELQSKKNELVERVTGHKLLKKTITDLNNLLVGLKTTKTSVSNTLKFFNDNTSCPTCMQGIPHDHKEHVISLNDKKEKEIIAGISRVEEELSKKGESLSTFEKIEKLIAKIDKEIYQKQSDISSHQKYIGNLQKELNSLSENKAAEDFNNVLNDLETKFMTMKQERVDLLEERQYYEVVGEMLKDGGIKTKIIKQYLPVMNNIVNIYLEKLGLTVDFTFDEQFNEVIRSRYRDTFSYYNFSEGEKQKLDLAILLAWRHLGISKNTINTNLMILDEVMDGHLDAQAREELLNILTEISQTSNIFVISHISAGDLFDKFKSSIQFQKVGNFSRMA